MLRSPPNGRCSARLIGLVADMREEWRSLDRSIDARTPSSPNAPGPMRLRAASCPFPVSVSSTQRRSSQRWATRTVLPAGARPRSQARPRAEADDDRRPAEAAQHHEARQRVSAQAVHSRRSERGCAVFLCARTATSRSGRSPTSWCGSPRRCWMLRCGV